MTVARRLLALAGAAWVLRYLRVAVEDLERRRELERRQALLAFLREEMQRQNDFVERVAAISGREAVRVLANVIASRPGPGRY